MTPRDWDATTYERLAAPMTAMGTEVLDRLVLDGDETVLDAGCGTGNVTRILLERLPRGRVIAVDAAPSMVEQARELLPAGVDVRRADLLELELEEPVDAVLSTATFHWIPDHDAMFRHLAAATRPGGWLVAQCGGAGNIANVQRVLATVGDGWLGAVHFEGVLATTRRLDAAGYVDIECWLTDEPTRFEAGAPFEEYLRTVVLGAHVARLPPAERDAFVHEVATRISEPVIAYVRLNIVARRSGR
jgi:trans-aconitate 2-methyltransferase